MHEQILNLLTAEYAEGGSPQTKCPDQRDGVENPFFVRTGDVRICHSEPEG